MWQNIVNPDRPPMTIWHKCIACCIPKAINTLSECVMLIVFHCNNVYTNAPSFCVTVHCVHGYIYPHIHTFIKQGGTVWVAYVAGMVEMNVQFW
jgi:hypothetical protein